MEVDDSVTSPPAEESESSGLAAENGRKARHLGRRLAKKRVVSKGGANEHPPELLEPPPPKTAENDEMSGIRKHSQDSTFSNTSFKLVVSTTEDELEQSQSVVSDTTPKQTERRPMRRELSRKQNKNKKKGNAAVKRKRYDLERSNSGEWLLGFDETSGEAVFVKEKPKSSQIKVDREETVKSPHSSPTRAVKKLKQSSASPKAQTPVQAQAQPPEPLKTHIVADNEELNGSPPIDADVNASSTPAPAAASISKKATTQNEFYKKPFEFGWKRELVWRANLETSKDKADVYFITPTGKKLRTRSDIVPLLEGDLTIEHFSFAREPLGVSSDYETVRHAKPSSRISVTAATLAAAPTTTNMGKRISKPKGPKGASPPPQGWTPTRALKVNNAALLSGASSSKHVGSITTPPVTPTSSRSIVNSGVSKVSKGKKPASNAESPVASVSSSALKHCTITCPRAVGQVPQLQCVKCVRLFHHDCVGLNRINCEFRAAGDDDLGRDYMCEACMPPGDGATKVSAPTALPRAAYTENKFPQTIVVVKGKKYVVVTKPVAAPLAEYSNDIENDLKQINDSMRNTRQQAIAAVEAANQPPNNVVVAAVEQSNRLFATNFFANVSFAYDALLCILKYLKIHERPRAAAVCKLWHLAAKDTSLWQTVRMKNSKVCNWAGFAAALRRGETKHLDLRKMLLASARLEEMWIEFSKHIGTVCSLESIDLCRCSAQVVENLFQSNTNLRVLNAIAIAVPINADTALNLEHISMLSELQELRLRTCEPCGLEGDLQPLAALTNLTHMSLTAIRGLGLKGVHVLGTLTQLRSLEMGECGDFDSTFAEVVLPKLVNLQRLRLENGQETACCTLKILEVIACLEQLSQLELVNFDIKPGFDEKLQHCANIRKLLIIPTYISQSATTNNIVLNAVQQVAATLKVFTWGVTVELLRVTALYVDQCEESTKKEKHHFDECIPVLKPVPGAPPADDTDESAPAKRVEEEAKASDVPQIEILPLDKVESILADNLPQTKFTIVKVPYHVTCKQQLVE